MLTLYLHIIQPVETEPEVSDPIVAAETKPTTAKKAPKKTTKTTTTTVKSEMEQPEVSESSSIVTEKRKTPANPKVEV